MRRQATFNKAFKAITSAYLSGTMLHGSRYAGAIGCIMHHKALAALKKKIGAKSLAVSLRGDVKAPFKMGWHEALLEHRRRGGSGSPKRFGGYTVKELHEIDKAFNRFNSKSDPDCFFGLHEAFNVLCRIHDVEVRSY